MKDSRSGHSTAAAKGAHQSTTATAAKAPGKNTRVQKRYTPSPGSVQAKGGDASGADDTSHAVQQHAASGIQGSGGSYPHQDAIQAAFGGHDISSVRAHVGGAAAQASEAMGAEAYATGEDVAFKRAPDLHTAAHEAAHVVQQRSGVSLPGGVGQAGDGYEKHADSVADAVVKGESAQGLLDHMSGGGSAAGVQRLGSPRTGTPPSSPHTTHTVVPGNTMWAISRANNVDIRAVIRANPHISDPNLIYPGDVLYIPAPEGRTGGGTGSETGGGTGGETGGGTGGGTGETGGGETGGGTGEVEDPFAALVAAVTAGDIPLAITLLVADGNGGLTALATAGKQTAFFTGLRDAKPYTAEQRDALADIYHSIPFELKKPLFEARFSVELGSIPDADGNTAEFTEGELDTLHDQAHLLPGGHVEGLATFTMLRRTLNATAEGSYGNPSINMDEENDAASYASTFRHEVGHAVDDALGAESQAFRIDQAGWTAYNNVAEFIAAMGGYGTLDADLHARLDAAIQAYLGGGSTFSAPTPTFEETLQQVVMAAHPEVTATAADGSDAVSQEMARFRAHYGSSTPLQVMIACEGDNNYWRYDSWAVASGKAFFVNHWYARPYSIASSTHSDLQGWPNQGSAQAAAFSDAEWFAETYSVWYSTSEPGTSHGWAGFVRTFFEGPVATLGGPGTAPEGGGGHPQVAR